MKVTIYADIVCPWCYIGATRFSRGLRSFSGNGDVDVEYAPFMLDPDAPTEPEPLEANLRRKYGRHAPDMMRQATEAGHREGLSFRLDDALAVNTLDAHRLLWHVRREHGAGPQVALMERLYRDYFDAGLNIAAVETLVDAASGVGIDEDEVRRLLASDEGRDEIRNALVDARALGVTAVPTFVFDDRYALQGAQEPAVFLQALKEVESARAA